MPSVTIIGQSKNGRTVRRSLAMRRAVFDDPAAIEKAARDFVDDAELKLVGWRYDDHPMTIDLYDDSAAVARAAGDDPDDALLCTVMNAVADNWKVRLKGGVDPETLRVELLAIARHLEDVAADPEPRAPGPR